MPVYRGRKEAEGVLITRSGILREVLEEKNREMHRYSKHEAGLIALEGYEKHFEDLRQTCEMLRGMIRNAEDREREDGLANWQVEVIKADCKGEHPDMSWADKVPQQTVDEMLLRRRYRQAEEFRPRPVVYPGGEE